MNINKVTLVGRVTKQPELKEFQGGSKFCAFSVATNYEWKDKNGEKQSQTEFHNIITFGKVAETIAKWVVKGQELYVEGRLKTDTYEKDGQKHYSTKIILENFQFGAKPKGSENQQQETSQVVEEEISHEEIPFF